MKRLIRNLKIASVFFLVLVALLLLGIANQQRKSREMTWGHSGENKLALRGQYAHAGSIYSSDGLILAESRNGERRYSDDPVLAASLVQLIGDYSHNIGNTVEERYQEILTGRGRSLPDEVAAVIYGRGQEGDHLKLSLHAGLCKCAAELLQPYRASMVLLDAENGDLLVMVNTPGVAPEQVISWEDIPEGSLYNKALLGEYSPGSTFKIITDTAYLDSPQFDPNKSVYCRGTEPLLGPGSVNELRSDAGHGQLKREEAFAKSCNHFFGTVGIEAGYDQLLKTAESFAFNQNLSLDGLIAHGGVFESPNRDDFVMSWLSIGQPVEGAKLYLSPLQLAMMAEAPINGGNIYKPELIIGRTRPSGKWEEMRQPEILTRAGSPESMRLLESDMAYSADYGLAAASNVYGYHIGAKTGTAQITLSTGETVNNALFCGYLNHPNKKIAMAIVIEEQSIDISQIAGSMFRSVIETWNLLPEY